MREETVGIVVTKSKGEDTSFAVFGDKNDYTQTELRKNKSEPLLFSVYSVFLEIFALLANNVSQFY